MTREQIKASWDKNRDSASGFGTKMHADIEDYYNGLEVQNDSIEFEFFRKFVKDFPELKPFRTEWMVFWEEMKISGSIDMIFENPDGTIYIYDWKRCREIAYENYDKYLKTPCVNHLPDTNFWHYSLQLNMYKTILETKYNKKVVGLYLVCLHPDNPYKTYDRIEVPFLEKEMGELLELRKFEIQHSI
jgi:ATP-dependent exoDNAse (exonuclease V) beta subunit